MPGAFGWMGTWAMLCLRCLFAKAVRQGIADGFNSRKLQQGGFYSCELTAQGRAIFVKGLLVLLAIFSVSGVDSCPVETICNRIEVWCRQRFLERVCGENTNDIVMPRQLPDVNPGSFIEGSKIADDENCTPMLGDPAYIAQCFSKVVLFF